MLLGTYFVCVPSNPDSQGEFSNSFFLEVALFFNIVSDKCILELALQLLLSSFILKVWWVCLSMVFLEFSKSCFEVCVYTCV